MNVLRLRQRAAITTALRHWFDSNGYLEVHTPTLVDHPALEEYLEPVHVGNKFLHTSPEFAMKRVLAEGLCRIYQIGPCFREEEQGVHHSQEFTMLEWYRAGAGTAEVMDEVCDLVRVAALSIHAAVPSFQRRTVQQLRQGVGLPPTTDEAEWFHQWVDKVEPTLTKPTIVYKYPSWQAAMATIRNGYADRFEVYLDGIEIANCFAEEGDAHVLRQRFHASQSKRSSMGKAPHPIDEKLLASTPSMPRTAGIAMGVDRLVMALTGSADIAEVQIR